MANITTLLKSSLRTNLVKSILFEIASNTSRYFYTFGRSSPWPTVIGPRTIDTVSVKRIDNVVTIDTVTSHDFIVGNQVVVELNDYTTLNGTYTITAVPSVTTFSYTKIGGNIAQVLVNGTIASVETTVISSENDPPSASDSYSYELSSRNDILLSKLIDSNDAAIVVKRVDWQPGIIYDMYDEYSGDYPSPVTGAQSLETATYYVLTDEFNVYKCLFNGSGARSTVKPASVSERSFKTSDGYIWKFLYTIPLSLRNKFLNSSYMPVVTSLTSQFYSKGSVTSYSIAATGSGYISGTYSLKTFRIVSKGSGYLSAFLNGSSPFTISKISRVASTQISTITTTTAHNLKAGMAVSINASNDTFDGIFVISTVPSSTTFTFNQAGTDVALNTTASGAVQATGVAIEFPLPPSGGTQAKAFVSSYSAGGAIEEVTISEVGSGYTSPPIATITTSGGDGFDYYIDYNLNKTSSYTELLVTGDGYSYRNPYTIKESTLTITNAGQFFTTTPNTSTDTFSFADPDLGNGRKPRLQPNYILSNTNQGTYQVTNSNTVSIEMIDHGFTTGQSKQLNFLLAGAIGSTTTVGSDVPANGLYTVTVVNTDNFTIQVTGSPITGTGSVVQDSVQYAIASITVLDEGYGYSEPFIFNTNVFAAPLSQNGFSIDLGTETQQKNHAQLAPLINAAGQIEAIQILDEGIGYTYASVQVIGKVLTNTGVLANISTTNRPTYSPASILLNFSVGDIESRQSTVELLAVNGSIEVINIDHPGSSYDTNSTCVVIGDGSGCTADLVISNGQIKEVLVTNIGAGYTYADVTIYDSNGVAYPSSQEDNTNTYAKLRPIISPKGGHGKDVVSELFARDIALVTRLSGEKNKGITPTNDYRQIMILKNPYIYNTNQYFRNSLGSACMLVTAAVNASNTNTYNKISLDDVLTIESSGRIYEFNVVEKIKIGNKYYMLLQPLSNAFVPSIGASFTKTVVVNQTSTDYYLNIDNVQVQEFDKFSGEILYIDNREKFSPSADQAIVVSTLISF